MFFYIKSKSKKTNTLVVSIYLVGILLLSQIDNFYNPANAKKNNIIYAGGYGCCCNFFGLFHVHGDGEDGIRGNTTLHWT